MNGWVRLHRQLLDSPTWKLPDGHRVVWITILLLANHKTNQWWNGSALETIVPGTFITSQQHLAEAAGVTRRVVQKAIKNLNALDSIRFKTRFKKYSLIEVVNWPSYQHEEDTEVQGAVQVRFKSGSSEVHNGRMIRMEEEELHCTAGAVPNGHDARNILAWLNTKAGKNFRFTPVNLNMIKCRMKEGITEHQIKAVISRKVKEWGTDEHMRTNLRPKTLFNRTNLENYIGELPKETDHELPGLRSDAADGRLPL